MSRLEQLLRRGMGNKVLDNLDANSLSIMRATNSGSVSEALRQPINYDWREETYAEREYRLRPQFDMEQFDMGPPPLLQLTASPTVNKYIVTYYIILDHETCEVTRRISKHELSNDLTGELRLNLARKANNQLISTWDIYDEKVENSPSFRIEKDGEIINMQSYRGTGRLGTLVYANGPLAGQRVLFDEKGRVISHPLRNSVYASAEGRKSRKSNRPKSKKSCKKRHMKWNSNTKRCNKKSK